jgi:hypothetical protein
MKFSHPLAQPDGALALSPDLTSRGRRALTVALDDVRASDVGEIVLSLCPAEAGVRRRETTPPVVVRYAS